MDNKNVFAMNLQRYMQESGKTRKEVCDALGFNYYTFSDWINGKKYPRMGKVEMLATYFGILKSDLIEDKSAASMLADDYRIAFETSAGKVDTVYVSDKQDNQFYSNGTVNYTFAQGLILSDLEITNVLAAAQVRVKNQLKTPDSAKFDLTTATMTKTWENGEMVYYVEEDFTAKNDLGVDISSSYTAIVKTKDGDTFEGDATISE